MRKRKPRLGYYLLATQLALFCIAPCLSHANAASLPAIISGRDNPVPDCVTAERLMEFAAERDRALVPPRTIDPKFSDVALQYSLIGQCVPAEAGTCIGVRWDYAFFQMLIETNYLLFTGGVPIEDNNFAGIGATVPGKPGERFASVREGVLAHLQHLLTYAGVSVADPAAQRTVKLQNTIHRKMTELGGPVTFKDLAALWTGTDKNTYAASIQRTAKAYSDRFCAARP